MKSALLKVTCGAAGALVVHVAVGWAWTIVAAAGAGFWQGRRGWLAGAASVGLSFAALMAYSFVVAAAPVERMGMVMGGILGGLPAAAVYLITGLVGLLLGTAGGGLGSGVRRLLL